MTKYMTICYDGVLDDYNDPDDDLHLYVVAVVDGWVEVGDDEVGVVRQPAHQEDGHHSHHHLHHLRIGNIIFTTNSMNIIVIPIFIFMVGSQHTRNRDTTQHTSSQSLH